MEDNMASANNDLVAERTKLEIELERVMKEKN